jgi:hypothetical protein
VSELPVEQRLIAAFADARASVHESPDLFARVNRSLAEARARRRFRWALAGGIFGFVLADAALALALSDFDNGRINMQWWVIELITDTVLVAIAVALGPFIKRFGRAYAADIFRANPRTGKSYLVLTDVAYYLIFTSFVFFTVTFVQPDSWKGSTGTQLEHEVARVGGILLIMGVLHAANVVALPVIGGLLSGNKRFDGRRPTESAPDAAAGVPPLGPGTWILRIDPASPSAVAADPPAVADPPDADR